MYVYNFVIWGCFADRIRKKLIKIFKDNGLKITIEMRLHKVDYLDVTLDLANNTYRPYKKPNDNGQQNKIKKTKHNDARKNDAKTKGTKEK